MRIEIMDFQRAPITHDTDATSFRKKTAGVIHITAVSMDTWRIAEIAL